MQTDFAVNYFSTKTGEDVKFHAMLFLCGTTGLAIALVTPTVATAIDPVVEMKPATCVLSGGKTISCVTKSESALEARSINKANEFDAICRSRPSATDDRENIPPENCTVIRKSQSAKDQLGPFQQFFLGNMRATAEIGRSNEAGRQTDGVNIPLRIDEQKDNWGLSIGFINKPVLGDFYRFLNPELMSAKNKESAERELFLDAFRLSATYGYGRVITDVVNGASTTENRTSFNVNLKYTVPIDRLLFHSTNSRY